MTSLQTRQAETINQYYNFLLDVKNNIDLGKPFAMNKIMYKHNVIDQVRPILYQKGLILKGERSSNTFYYHWTTTVKPSKQMAKAIVDEFSKKPLRIK